MSALDSFNVPAPLRPLDKVVMWGHPFHGLVQSGMLTLPNDDTLIYSQPSSADAWALHLAGVPELTRTAEQLAQDAELGHQWLHKVVLSGQVPQVYGKALVGSAPAWLWRDGAGVVWQFSLPRLSTYQTSIRVVVRKFGRFGEPAFTPVNVDLSHAVDDGAFAVDLSTTNNNNEPDTVLRICDITEDGGSVIVGIFRDPRQTTFTPRGGSTYILRAPVESALGFLRIDAAAGETVPSLTLNTLRNHRASLGTVSGSASRLPAGDYADLPLDETNTFRQGTVTYVTTRAIGGRVVSMYFDGDTPKAVMLAHNNVVETTRQFDKFPVAVPGYGEVDFFYLETAVQNILEYSLSIDGVPLAAFDIGGTLSASFISLDLVGEVEAYCPGSDFVYHKDAVYPIGSFDAPTESGLLGLSRNLTQTGFWAYSKKLFCLFRISAGGTVTWSDTFAPGASAAAQPPASGGWVATGAGSFSLGPATWYRARDPVTGAISGAYSSTVCFV